MENTESVEIELHPTDETQSENEPRIVRLKIPPEQRVFIELLARKRRIKFHEVVYELIRDRIKYLTDCAESSQPTQDALPLEDKNHEMKRIEAHLIEIKEALQSSGNGNSDRSTSANSTSTDTAETSEEDEGHLARMMTAILQGHLQPPIHRLTAQIETFQKEVRDSHSEKCDRDQNRDRGELDRWFVAKAELEVLRSMLNRVVLAATPPEHRAEFVESIAYVTERFRQFESRLPPLPDYFLPSNGED